MEIFPFYQQHHIRFTTNGNRPTAQSRLYTEPMLLDDLLYSTSDIYSVLDCPPEDFFLVDSVSHCIVIRAAVFDENDSCISEVATNSYFIRALGCDTHGLPVVSLCADTLDLFDYEYGIFVPGVYWDSLDPQWTGNYYQDGEDWERPANIEFYELDNEGINQQAGLRTHGGNGRRFQQKGVKLYARGKYGKSRFEHRFFDQIPQNSFKHLVLKPFVATWNNTGINDHIGNQIASQLDVESLASRPVELYLNGEYWGIYFMHERPDSHYLEDHFGVDPERVTLIAGWKPKVECGDETNFLQLYDWFSDTDLSDSASYAYAESKIDMSSFIDHYVFELFSENTDWPANNMRWWQLDDGKWRWFVYDNDACYCWMNYHAFENAVYEGTSIWPSSRRATLFFRRLCTNRTFRDRFKSRFLELLGTVFSYSNTNTIFEMTRSVIAPAVPFQSERFGIPRDYDTWNTFMGNSKWFLQERCNGIVNVLDEFLQEAQIEDGGIPFIVFPNPTDGDLHVVFDADSLGSRQIAIYDLMGRKVDFGIPEVVQSSDGDLITIPLDLARGIYVLRIGNQAVKIVKQ